MIKDILLTAGLVAAGYLLGKSKSKEEKANEEKAYDDAVAEAQKHAANLTDDDCDALRRMFDKFKR